MTLSGVTRRRKTGRDEESSAGPLWIETFEGSRPLRFGRAIAYWVLQDSRYAFHAFWKKPGFLVITLLILALGIGATPSCSP